MKFENLMYDKKIIKVIVDLDESFIENNDDLEYSNDDYDTLDLSSITADIFREEEDKDV